MSAVHRRTFLGATAALAASAGIQHSAAADDPNASEMADPATLGKTPHTRFAVNIEMWFTKHESYLERMRQSAALGFPSIEFWNWRPHDIGAFAATAQQLGIEIAQFTAWGFEPGLNNPKNHDAFVKAVQEGCQTAHKLNCQKMCVVGGNNQPGMTKEEMHAHIIEGLKRAAPIAESEDVMLVLEPMNGRVDHPGHCLYGSPDAVRICREVGSTHVKVLWDLYHMHISEGDLCGHLREGFEQLGYVQVADHPGRNEPGTGEIHYNRVLEELYNLGYRGIVGLECRPKTTELAAAQAVAKADVW